ncbi:phosphatase PAP2 family protein [Candidatus Giovannonibacteria bacterium]|nr:phosphatase PAP2 family protein [Candidatus Giovannonibacteria bacterium]
MNDFLINFFGNYLAWIFGVILFFFLISKNKKRFFVGAEALIAAILSRFIFTEVIRLFYNRPRPFELTGIEPVIPHEIGYSFPSGHAAFFFALAVTIYFYDRRWGIIFFTGAVLMGAARVFAGVHWTTDILGGAVLGVMASLLVHRVFLKIHKKSG